MTESARVRPTHGHWFCAVCGTHAAPASSEDPWADMLRCEQGHRCLTGQPAFPASATETAASRVWPGLLAKPLEDIARFWLADPSARSVLNEDLATILRTFLDGAFAYRFEPHYCPLCGLSLVRSEEEDSLWLKALRCKADHACDVRGSRITSVINGEILAFEFEPSPHRLREMATGWLQPRQQHRAILDANLHESVRLVLQRIASSC